MRNGSGAIASNIEGNKKIPWLPRQIGFAVCACFVTMFVDVLWELFSITQTATRRAICGVTIAVDNSPEQLSTQFSLTPWCYLFIASFIAVWLLIAGIIHHCARTNSN